MGNSPSKTVDSPRKLSRPEEIISTLPKRDPTHPAYFLESTLNLFTESGDVSSSSQPNVSRSKELGALLLGSYEQLTQIPVILDLIISYTDVGRSELIDTLESEFSNYRMFAEMRGNSIRAIKDFTGRFFPSGTDTVRPGKGQRVDNAVLMSAISAVLDFVEKKKCDKEMVKRVTEGLENSLPCVAFSPPKPEFLSQNLGHRELLAVRSVHCHGICSNGLFLFVLCEDRLLQICCLLNGGSLLHPVQREIKAEISPDASMIATRDTIVIFSGTQVLTMKVTSLLADDGLPIEPEVKTRKADYICYLSDGIVSVRLDNDFSVRVKHLATDKLLRKLKLTEGYAPLDPHFPVLFPNVDYSQIPMLMNGLFLGFVFRIDTFTTLFRVFSLINGHHCGDEIFKSPDQYYGGCCDTLLRCHWMVSMMDNNRLGVRRFYCAGSCNPHMVGMSPGDSCSSHGMFNSFLSALNRMVVHYLGSQIVPNSLLCHDVGQLEQLLMLQLRALRSEELHEKHEWTLFLQDMCILIDINVRYFAAQIKLWEDRSESQEGLRSTLFQIIAELPTDLGGFVFFNSLPCIDWSQDDIGISYLVSFFKRVECPALFVYGVRKVMSSSGLANVSFDVVNAVSQLVPSDPISVQKMSKPLQGLALLHQRVLVTEALLFLQNECSDALTHSLLVDNEKKGNVIGCLHSYVVTLLSRFDICMNACTCHRQLVDSFTMLLFRNLVSLLSSLTDYHIVAQGMAMAFSNHLTQVVNWVKGKQIDVNSDSELSRITFEFVMLYSKFMSTLLKGGQLSDFEKSFTWLIKDNIELVDQKDIVGLLVSSDIEDFDDERLNQFLGDSASLDIMYSKFRPMMNRNLSNEMKQLDRLALSAFCRHAGILEELFSYDGTQPLSSEMKMALEQMLRLRSKARENQQHGRDINQFLVKCLMLHRLKSHESHNAKETAGFLFTKQAPETIVKIIRQQKIRNDLTLIGFSMITEALAIEEIPVFRTIFASNLAQIENFQGLCAILAVSTLTEQQVEQIRQFFLVLLRILRRGPNPKLALVAFRFFRDCSAFPSIEGEFLTSVLQIVNEDQHRYPLFSVAMSLIPRVTVIADILRDLDSKKPLNLMLLSEALKVVPGDRKLYLNIVEFFWKLPENLMRLGCRLLYQSFAATQLPVNDSQKLVNDIINYIGDQIVQNAKLETAAELIWVLRKIIVTKSSKYDVVMQTILESEPSDDIRKLVGVFAVLNGFIDPLRPYCSARIHAHTGSVECILVKHHHKTYQCYSLPFSPKEPSQSYKLSHNEPAYAVPILSLRPTTFNNYEFILKFFDFCFIDVTSPFAVVYMRCLMSCMKFVDFAACWTLQHTERLCSMKLIPFHTIWARVKRQRELREIKILPEKDGFGVLRLDGGFVSYLSPQICPDADSFFVSVKCKSFKGYIGVVSDVAERYSTRYSVVSVPSGIWFPYHQRLLEFPHDLEEIVFTVNVKEQSFSVCEQTATFPVGERFRVIIAARDNHDLTILAPDHVFNVDASPVVADYKLPSGDEKGLLFIMPEAIISLQKTLWADVKHYDDIKLNLAPEMLEKHKILHSFIEPPELILIHPGFALECSASLMRSLMKGMNEIFVYQFTVILLMRIVARRPDLISDAATLTRLFSLMAIPLEKFIHADFEQGKFPFHLNSCLWLDSTLTNSLCWVLDNDAKAALQAIVQKPDFPAQLIEAIKAMAASKEIHMLAFPNRYHLYHPSYCFPGRLKLVEAPSVVSVTSFDALRDHAIEIDRNPQMLPMINPGISRTLVVRRNTDISEFLIGSPDNMWIFNTPFEFLLLMRHFVHMRRTPEIRTVLKSILIECFAVQSPFIFPYLAELMEFIQLSMPGTPYDKMSYFIQHMQLLGVLLKNYQGPAKTRYLSFYKQEQGVMTSKYAAEIVTYFPEFVHGSQNRNSGTVKIPKGVLDPGALSKDPVSYLKMLRLYTFQYSSIEDFPFWNILPIWLRISGAWSVDPDLIEPMQEFRDDVCHISNPSCQKMKIRFIPKSNPSFKSMICYSEMENFEDATFIPSTKFSDVITSKAKDLYISLLDFKGSWSKMQLRIQAKSSKGHSQEAPRMVEPVIFHDKFVSEITEFAVKWTQEDTEELGLLLPRYALRDPKFAAVQSIAEGSSLTSKYSMNVVLLRAAMIHHYNYLKYKKHAEVPEYMWDSMTMLRSVDDALDVIGAAISCGNDKSYPTFRIDRRAAHRLIVEGGRSPERSIICQLTHAFKKIEPVKLRCRKRPWKIKFIGEQAIDAGGPSRELLTEAAISIIEPTSQLFVQVPNARNGIGSYRDTYIPFDKTGHRFDDYSTIGTFLGIIVRTGLSQDLPFAPIVWKYIARERPTSEDILSIDESLSERFKHMKEAAEEPDFEVHHLFPWQIEHWDGTPVTLPGHSSESIVMRDQIPQFIQEAIQFRINTLITPLQQIRNAFEANVSFTRPVVLTGALLSRMAQGTSIISVEHLKAIAVYSRDFEGGPKNEYIQRFWTVFEKFTEEQKKMMLRFVTTLTRLPDPNVNPDFKFQIDKMNTQIPDETLPTASTCFNRLHLPAYSTEEIARKKILYAIQFCQTMDQK